MPNENEQQQTPEQKRTGAITTTKLVAAPIQSEVIPPEMDDDYRGAGGKDALKADLADERKKRQALESQLAEQKAILDRLAAAFGGDTEAEKPEDVAARIQQTNEAQLAQMRQLALTNAIHDAMPKDVDPRRVLRNVDFLDAVKDADPADRDGIAKAITDFATANPWVKTTPASGGDLHTGGTTPTADPGPGVARIAAAAEQKFGTP